MRRKYEPQGTDISPDAPDEVWERGEDGALHLVDIDALLDKGDCGLLTDDDACDDCKAVGDDYYTDANGDSQCWCDDCPNNPYGGMYEDS